jgi:hypothetical protein
MNVLIQIPSIGGSLELPSEFFWPYSLESSNYETSALYFIQKYPQE